MSETPLKRISNIKHFLPKLPGKSHSRPQSSSDADKGNRDSIPATKQNLKEDYPLSSIEEQGESDVATNIQMTKMFETNANQKSEIENSTLALNSICTPRPVSSIAPQGSANPEKEIKDSYISGKKPSRKQDNETINKYIRDTFEKRECSIRYPADANKDELCKCGYHKNVHSEGTTDEPLNLFDHLTTDAFGKMDFSDDEEEEADSKNIRYVRLDYETKAGKVWELFNHWKIGTPNVILSVISDSDHFTDKGNEVTESIQKTRKKICRRLVEAAASTNSLIITGGLNNGVDQVIGNEVKQRLTDEGAKRQAVLGICNWGCLKEKKPLLNSDSSGPRGFAYDNNSTGQSLNPNHTHFLLVDDGTQNKSGCECTLRENVESHKKRTEITDKDVNARDKDIPLMYILIGGGVNAFTFVERALGNDIPVLIVTGTGGAADIISKELMSKDDATRKTIKEIYEKLSHWSEELLGLKSSPIEAVKQVHPDITAKAILQLFIENIQLLQIAIYSNDDLQLPEVQQAKKDTESANNFVVEIRSLVNSKQTAPISSSRNNISAAEAVFDAIVRRVTEQIRDARGIPSDKAMQIFHDIESYELSETLTKVKGVFNVLKTIREKEQTNLLKTFEMTGSQKNSITSCIADALKKVNRKNPGDVYMLVADWDDEKLFEQLLRDEWTDHDQSEVLEKLLQGRVKIRKYVELVIKHNKKKALLMEPVRFLEKQLGLTERQLGLKEKHFRPKGYKICERLLTKFKQLPPSNNTEDRRASLRGQMLFFWCVQNTLRESAMRFWKRGQDCLAMALTAFLISKKQRKKLVDKEGYEEAKQQEQYFSQLAIKLLEACYADNHQNTRALLSGKVEDFSKSPLTPLEIAVKANFSTFISLVPIQALLHRIWIKGIENYNKKKYVPMLLSEACPLLAPALFNIRLPATDDRYDGDIGKVPTRKSVKDYFLKVRSFIDTPLVKFTYGFASYIGYLILFSVVMLTDFRSHVGSIEICLHVWTLILFIEEIKQIMAQKSEYLNLYNFFDIGALIIYLIGFILRMRHHSNPTNCPACLYVARIILAFSLLIFFIRALQFLWIYNEIGPKIYMMRRLLADLVGFMLILIVFVSAYGVVSNVILYPNQPLNLNLLHNVYYDSSWSVLQQFNREETSGSRCSETNNGSISAAKYCSNTSDNQIDYVWCKKNQCPSNDWIVSVLLAVYALFTVIMLLNVLIAMFNATFAAINEKEKGVSKMQRYRLICEYSSQSMIPTPLCAIAYPYFLIKYLRRLASCEFDNQSQTGPFGALFNQDVEARSNRRTPKGLPKASVIRWENKIAKNCYKMEKGKPGCKRGTSEESNIIENRRK